MKKLIYSMLITIVAALTCTINAQPHRETLTNAKIVALVRVGLSEAIIMAKIRQSLCQCDTRIAAIQKLKSAGVSEAVILAMVESSGAAAPASSSPPVGTIPPQMYSESRGESFAKSNAPAGTALGLPMKSEAQDVIGPKRYGVPRIGIATTETIAPEEQDNAVRAQLYETLYGNRSSSTTEAVLMQEKLDRNIESEARATRSDYLLYIKLESEIESAAKKKKGLIEKLSKVGREALGVASTVVNPFGSLAAITYRGHNMANSLEASQTLLQAIGDATEKNDSIKIRYKLIATSTGEVVIPETLKDIVAKKDKEPILRNLLIQLGNEILNSIPANQNSRRP